MFLPARQRQELPGLQRVRRIAHIDTHRPVEHLDGDRTLRPVGGDFAARGQREQRDPERAIAVWVEDHPAEIEQFGAIIDRAKASLPVSSAMLAHITGLARKLFARE